MSFGRRILNIIAGLLIITGAALMMMLPEAGYVIIAAILGFTLLFSGIKSLIYFFTMARHMVGGRDTLYSALIKIDFALFTMSVADVPKIFVMMYLVAVFGVSGLLHVMRGLEARKKKAANWRGRFTSGVINLVIAALCLIFIRNTVVMVMIYSIGLVFMGLGRIGSAFQRAKIVYIQ